MRSITFAVSMSLILMSCASQSPKNDYQNPCAGSATGRNPASSNLLCARVYEKSHLQKIYDQSIAAFQTRKETLNQIDAKYGKLINPDVRRIIEANAEAYKSPNLVETQESSDRSNEVLIQKISKEFEAAGIIIPNAKFDRVVLGKALFAYENVLTYSRLQERQKDVDIFMAPYIKNLYLFEYVRTDQELRPAVDEIMAAESKFKSSFISIASYLKYGITAVEGTRYAQIKTVKEAKEAKDKVYFDYLQSKGMDISFLKNYHAALPRINTMNENFNAARQLARDAVEKKLITEKDQKKLEELEIETFSSFLPVLEYFVAKYEAESWVPLAKTGILSLLSDRVGEPFPRKDIEVLDILIEALRQIETGQGGVY